MVVLSVPKLKIQMKMEVSNLDVVVWNGIITTFGTIKSFISFSDRIRLVNEEELIRYIKYQK